MLMNRRSKLDILIQNLPEPMPDPILPLEITGIVFDSRKVQPGDLFVALVGGKNDGHGFIPDAIQRGAVAVVGTANLEDLEIPYFKVADSRRALAYLAATFYDFPSRHLTMIGVTGTDGKTTTANLIFSVLEASGLQTGMITTVNAVIGNRVLDTGFHVTTPEATDVQHYLAQMVSVGLTHVVLEATSHGLAQHRVTACDFDLGVVTNITHEHLDYHGSYDAYRQAKARLFTDLVRRGGKDFLRRPVAVLNRDDSSYAYLSDILDPAVKQVVYGQHPGGDIWSEDIQCNPDGMYFNAVGDHFSLPIASKLVGDYNVSNCLAAVAATLMGLELPPEAVRKGIAGLQGIPGRMESLDLGQDFTAIVDFAHTPNALQRSLQAARRILQSRSAQAQQSQRGRIIAIFGSAGLRDQAKRRMMAEISAELADLTILTAEDPRTESLEAILADMADGAKSKGGKEGNTFWRVPDRGEAIRFGISIAQTGDIVLALGKGHEQSMCFGEIEYPWDDRIAMRAALAEYLRIPGPLMPYLPTQK